MAIMGKRLRHGAGGVVSFMLTTELKSTLGI